MKPALLALLILALAGQAHAQTASLQGRIVNRKARAPLAGVYVRLTGLPDTSEIHQTTTGDNGTFLFPGLAARSYRLDATRVGYARLRQTVRVERQGQDLGTLVMMEEAIPLREITVEGEVPPAEQKGDTTEFTARAFKTNPDATAGDLLAKVPGITIDKGTVKSNSETVQRVLVDGKPFFGNDPNIALQSLPAEAIEKIQIFDKLSEQAEFTGFDDGQSQKTVNFTLRPERRSGEFGKAYAGYGDQGRFLAGGNLNMMRGERRLSLIELSNNISQQNFSAQDLLGVLDAGGGGGRGRGGAPGGGGGGFGGGGPGGLMSLANLFVGQQNGMVTTHSLGSNYTDTWGRSLQASQSYFFNSTDNENTQGLSRQYVGRQDSVTLYEQSATSEARNYNHRYDSRMEFSIDSSNSFVVMPRLYFQSNHAWSDQTGANYTASGLRNQAASTTGSATTGNNLSGNVVFRHKFAKRGRTISADVGAGHNTRTGSSGLHSVADYIAAGGTLSDTADQQSDILSNGYSLNARVVYTEPVGRNGLLQFTYAPRTSHSEADNRVHLLDPLSGTYVDVDTGLSNTYSTTNSVQNGGVGYLTRWGRSRFSANLFYQGSTLHGEQTFPVVSTVDRTFLRLTPSLNLNWRISDQRNLSVFARASTNPPSVSQLQNVVDNSNPLALTSGNPDLAESYNQLLVSRYSSADPVRSRSFFLLLSVQHTTDYIATSTLTAARDTVLAGGVVMKQGTQLAYPVNLDGYWRANSFATVSVPAKFLGGLLNLSSGLAYTRTPALIDQEPNESNTYTVTGGVVLSSNRSENFDYTISYMGNYNMARNSAQSSLDDNYYSHVAAVKLNVTLWNRVVLRNELGSTYTGGLTSGYNQDILLWNAGLGVKMFQGNRGELRLTATDLLDQNKSTSRAVTGTYIEDTRNRVLGRCVMLVFTYTVRPAAGMQGRDRPPGFRMRGEGPRGDGPRGDGPPPGSPPGEGPPGGGGPPPGGGQEG